MAALLQQLGPTYVKIGQMLAARQDLLPTDWTTEFARLQADAEPFPWLDAVEVIKAELGRLPEELFASIEQEPFAAASTAQVHRATLADGTLVAVKIQRPRIVAKTKADLGVMQELAKTAEQRFALARRIGIRKIVGEFASGVLEELDYRNEAYHARRLADAMSKFEQIHIPVVYEDLSSSRVLTMEFVKGIKIEDPDILRDAGLDPSQLGATFMRAIIKQVLIDGFFHADPHPGNVLADPVANRDRLPRPGPRRPAPDGAAGRPPRAGLRAQGSRHLGHRRQPDRARRADLDASMRPASARQSTASPGSTWSTAQADSIGTAPVGLHRRGVRVRAPILDSQLTLAVKAIVQAEDTARRLAYDLDMGQAAVEEAQDGHRSRPSIPTSS